MKRIVTCQFGVKGNNILNPIHLKGRTLKKYDTCLSNDNVFYIFMHVLSDSIMK